MDTLQDLSDLGGDRRPSVAANGTAVANSSVTAAKVISAASPVGFSVVDPPFLEYCAADCSEDPSAVDPSPADHLIVQEDIAEHGEGAVQDGAGAFFYIAVSDNVGVGSRCHGVDVARQQIRAALQDGRVPARKLLYGQHQHYK